RLALRLAAAGRRRRHAGGAGGGLRGGVGHPRRPRGAALLGGLRQLQARARVHHAVAGVPGRPGALGGAGVARTAQGGGGGRAAPLPARRGVNDRPSAAELLAAVEQFLEEEAVPALEGPARFHARVAANVLRIVARELATEDEH